MPLNKSMVFPHLEYSVQIWPPHLKKVEQEKVWRKATKMITGMEWLRTRRD